MASKKKSKDIIVTDKSKIRLQPATIFESSNNRSDIERPAFLETEGAFEKEAPSGFTPLIQFGDDPENWQAGTWIIARYVSARENIGPNASYMYDFEITADNKEFKSVSLWGSTILDNKMRLLNPHPGQWIFIQYRGVVNTSRKLSPAKDFDVAIISETKMKTIGSMIGSFKTQA